jgi:hypothetical protein
VERPRQPGKLIAVAALDIIVCQAQAVPEAGKCVSLCLGGYSLPQWYFCLQ